MEKQKQQGYGFWRWGMAAVLVMSTVLLGPRCAAQVLTTVEEAGPADCVYIAGNPDLYPIEYYDSEQQCYRGILPELLGMVAEDTGISFAYVNAGSEDSRLEMARNSQVEMVTAFRRGEFSRMVLPVQRTVLTTETDGRETAICVGFTGIIKEDQRERIVEALEAIPEEDKTTLAISFTMGQEPQVGWEETHLAGVVALAAVAVTLITVGIIRGGKRKKSQKNAMLDPLTGLGNAQCYEVRFRDVTADRVRDLYYVGYLAWEDAKAKELLSPKEQEEVQQIAAHQLASHISGTEFLCRMADGVFAVVYHCSNREEAADRMGEMILSLKKYLAEFRQEYTGLFRAGICPLEENPDCDARGALYYARQGWQHAHKKDELFAFSTRELQKQNSRNEQLRQDIDRALANGEIKAYLQFIVDNRTGEICGAEVLSRWEHPELGVMRPGTYIGVMKQTGAITRHDEAVFERLCALLEVWKGTPCGKLFLTCNFTRVSISQEDFAERIGEIAGRYRFDHDRLIIEITEDSLIQNGEQAAANIEACRKMGFKIAIDDMGSGFTALSDLYSHEIDLVKIERSVVLNAMTEKGARMLKGLIALAHDMGTRVLCEGVETAAQHEMIRETGCDMVQGFYYSRVLPLPEALRYLQSKGFIL